MFSTVGPHTIAATATDSDGVTGHGSITVNVVNTAPVVAISRPVAGASVPQEDSVQLLGSASDLNEGPGPGPGPVACQWTSSNTGDAGFPLTGCDVHVVFKSRGTRTLRLSATDPQGLRASAAVSVTVTAPLTNSPPSIMLGSLPPTNYNSDGYRWDLPIAVTASAVDPEGNTPITYRWIATSYMVGGTTSTVFASNVQVSALTTSGGNLNWTPIGTPSLFISDCSSPSSFAGQIVRLTLVATDSLGNARQANLPDIKVYPCFLF
jgi:hypothetical protein